MKDYYSILKSFFSKNNNQERLDQLEKIQGNETALIKLFNQIKPESKDYSINKTSNTMKISELKAQIREEILATLSEVTVVDKNTKPEEVKDEDPNTVKSAIDTAKKTNKAVNIAEEDNDGDRYVYFLTKSIDLDKYIVKRMPKQTSKSVTGSMRFKTQAEAEAKARELNGESQKLREEEDNYDFDEKEPSKSDMKKDSVATTANKLQKLITKMKALAKEYKQAKESKDEAKVKKITDQLKTMTKEKKQLEKAL